MCILNQVHVTFNNTLFCYGSPNAIPMFIWKKRDNFCSKWTISRDAALHCVYITTIMVFNFIQFIWAVSYRGAFLYFYGTRSIERVRRSAWGDRLLDTAGFYATSSESNSFSSYRTGNATPLEQFELDSAQRDDAPVGIDPRHPEIIDDDGTERLRFSHSYKIVNILLSL